MAGAKDGSAPTMEEGNDKRVARTKLGKLKTAVNDIVGDGQSKTSLVSFFLQPDSTLEDALKFENETYDFNLAAVRERLELFATRAETSGIASSITESKESTQHLFSACSDSNSHNSYFCIKAPRRPPSAEIPKLFGSRALGAYLELVPSCFVCDDDDSTTKEHAPNSTEKGTSGRTKPNANLRVDTSVGFEDGKSRGLNTVSAGDCPTPRSALQSPAEDRATRIMNLKSRRTTGVLLGIIVLPDPLYVIFKNAAGGELTGLMDVTSSSHGVDTEFQWNPVQEIKRGRHLELKIRSGKLSVESGTPMDLVFLLTEPFEDSHKYIEFFINVHRYFANSIDVIRILIIEHFLVDINLWKDYTPWADQMASSLSRSKLQNLRRLRIVNVLRKWMSIRQEDFMTDSILVLMAKKLIEYHNICSSGNEIFTAAVKESLDTISKELGLDRSDVETSNQDPVYSVYSPQDTAADAMSETTSTLDPGRRATILSSAPLREGNVHKEDSIMLTCPTTSRLSFISAITRENTYRTTSTYRDSAENHRTFLLRRHSHVIAQQLCLIDEVYLRKISADELSVHLWNVVGSKVLKELTANLVNAASWFNRVARCASSTILSESSAKARSKLIAKFIRIAIYCLDYYNFSSCFAIYCGLSSAPVIRLKKSWLRLSRDTMAMWERIQNIISSKNSYGVYRSKLAEALGKGEKCAFIPYFGVAMSDVTFIDAGNKNFTSIYPNKELAPVKKDSPSMKCLAYTGFFASYLPAASTSVNFSKFRSIYKATSLVNEAKNRTYSFPVHDSLQNFLANAWPTIGDDDQLMAISRNLEPLKTSSMSQKHTK